MPLPTVSASRCRKPQHVRIGLAVVAIHAAACATANDPTRRADVRAEVSGEAAWLVSGAARQDRTARDVAGSGGLAVADTTSACVANPASRQCAERRRLVDRVLALVAEAPRDRYVIGEGVYALARVGLYHDALEALDACATERWWCHALRGHVFAESRRIIPAGAAFDSALIGMPEPVRCAWTNLSLYVWGGAWPAYEAASCLERLERLERLWWLADPAWLAPGNDREVEHYNRVISIMLKANSAAGGVDDRTIDRLRARRTERRLGSKDDQWILFGTRSIRDPALWWRQRSREIVYNVIPRAPALLDPFNALPEDWPIVPAGMMEHYEPEFGRLAPLAHQVAFFERGDSLLAIAAADVPDSLGFGSARRARAVLFLQTGPGAPPLTAETIAEAGRWLFRVRVPPSLRRRHRGEISRRRRPRTVRPRPAPRSRRSAASVRRAALHARADAAAGLARAGGAADPRQ